MNTYKSSSLIYTTTLLVLVLLFGNINQIDAYKYGDIIRFSKKSYHDLRETDWNDIRVKFSPRFQVDRTITLSSLTSIPLGESSLYKISFSLDNDRFKTSWITVADGQGTFLNHIEFKFTYSNDKIVDVKWTLDYNDEEVHHKKKPDHIYLIYRWEEAQDIDISAGLFILFTVGLSISGFLFTFIAFQFQYIDTKNKSTKVSLPFYESPLSTMGYSNNNNRDSFRNSNNSINNSINDQDNSLLNNSGNSNTYYRSSPPNTLSISHDGSNGNFDFNNNNSNNNNNKDFYDIPNESEMDSFIETKQL
ncbi:hypothetical protein CYY_008566 [Polysphondylium violaceum]|uniref:Uncharacterized protein n=1 Tax=Polysphondylium violaceum TaxID=133409 RepID=A0A8J4PQ81_9MYCE|nr:hypothetical protein CYY_008566 [Polysphondylium violaceum]